VNFYITNVIKNGKNGKKLLKLEKEFKKKEKCIYGTELKCMCVHEEGNEKNYLNGKTWTSGRRDSGTKYTREMYKNYIKKYI